MTPSIDKFIGAIPVVPSKISPTQVIPFFDSIFTTMANIGMASVRLAFWWSRTDDSYFSNLFFVDQAANRAAAHGWRVYGIINPPVPPQPAGWTPPTLPQDTIAVFKRYVTDMAQIYGDRIEHWEILNEANHDNADTSGQVVASHFDGVAFASLLREAYNALHAGFTARPDYAQLVAKRGGAAFKMYPAGTAGTDLAWIGAVCTGLDALYQAHPGEGPYIDGFSIHPFSAPKGPDEDSEFNSPSNPHPKISQGNLVQNIEWARLWMGGHPRVPQKLFIGEYGWSTASANNPAIVVAADAQARYLAQGFLEAHACGAVDQVINAWAIIDMNGEWDYWDHTGLVDTNGVPKPSFYAVQNLIARLRGMAPIQNLSWLQPDGRMFLYHDAGKNSFVHWNRVSAPVTATISSGAHIRLYSESGTLLRDEIVGNAPIAMTSGPDSQYLEVSGGTILAINGVRLTAAGVPTVQGTPIRVVASKSSAHATGNEPQKAFDGNPNTWWNAGAFGTAWLEAAFQAPLSVRAMTLLVNQLPSGVTQHDIQFQINGAYRTVHSFHSHTANGMTLAVQFPQAIANVARVRITTVSSPSYPAWGEVNAFS